jgi:hypothetical protein
MDTKAWEELMTEQRRMPKATAINKMQSGKDISEYHC